MKKTLTISVLAALVLCGCQKEELTINKTTEQKTFTAEIESNLDGVATRTSLSPSDQSNQFNVVWSAGDQVSIFAGSAANAQYQVAEAGKTSATLNPVSSESGTGDAVSTNVAYYPYSSSVAISEAEGSYTISGITLPATQTYAQASFAGGAFPMAAVTASTDDTNLNFKNILGGLKLQLTGTAKVRTISVSGNNGEILCGSVTVTVSSSAEPKVTLSDASATTVTLDCGESGVQLDETTATPFIIALPPVTMSSGFTVTVTDTDGNTMDISTTSSKTITRSTLLKMKAVKFAGEDPSQKPFTITSVGNTTVKLVEEGSPDSVYLEYRKNNDDSWSTFKCGTEYGLSAGDVLQIRAKSSGNIRFAISLSDYYYLSTTGDGTIKVSGNIMSLLDQSMKSTRVSFQYAFAQFFNNNKKLTDASNLKLPATALAKYCYEFMFNGCSALTTAPELPATTLAEWCYAYMFQRCSSLTAAPELPATALAEWCYAYMFQNCSSLTTAPELPATTLTEGCYYQMFASCGSLTAAPELPAATLVQSCYKYMFRYCSNLKYVKALFTTTPADNYLENWVFRVSDTGTFVMSKDAEWEPDSYRGQSGIPREWDVETE